MAALRLGVDVTLYDKAHEHDGCGVACVARLDGKPRREAVERGIEALVRLEHRGAEGADPTTGDGAGILVQLPDAFLRAAAGVELPDPGGYGVAVCFLPQDEERRGELERLLETCAAEEGLDVLAWRDVPVVASEAGVRARESAPVIRQLFLAPPEPLEDQDALERRLYVFRRVVELRGEEGLALPSCSSRTIVYKGMLSAPQLAGYYPDLHDERFVSALAIVHSRFSTNTFPSWELAHPYRMCAHNGEFNTLLGNRNWMRAREAQLASSKLGDDLQRVLPVVPPGASDSATFDSVLELLVMAGRSLPHAVMMMMPEAHEGRPDLPPDVRGFYDFHACLMEPWDGPASITFTDGRILGATLDRNGLRPGRWAVTQDGWVVLASEAGAFDLDPKSVVRKGRLLPGRLFIADLTRGRVLPDRQVERGVAERKPYGAWYANQVIHMADLPESDGPAPDEEPNLALRRLALGYTQEDLRVLIGPMAADAKEPTGSMGNDAALAVLSDRQPPLFSYFKQLFAQVTNPAIDPVREDVVMSLRTFIGPEGDLLSEQPDQARRLVLEQPVLTAAELERIRGAGGPLTTATLDATWAVEEGPEGLDATLDRLCAEADAALERGAGVLVVSDRTLGPERAPVPALLAVATVHHHLVRQGTRLRAGIVAETGEAREVHHVATLIGYGAGAVCPYLMLASAGERQGAVITALGKALLKVISKMGISTIHSYCGAQVFEAVGLEPELIERSFTGTPSRIGGIGLEVLATEALERHARAWPDAHGRSLPQHVEQAELPAAHSELLPQGGVYAWRRDGERHMWDPETIASLQHSVAGDGHPEAYEAFSRRVNEENAKRGMLRGLLRFRSDSEPVRLSDVEPATEIVKRFATGGMSLGALSPEAHETLAVAMNRLGGKSNSGEGGEDARRYEPDENGDSRRSAIKQVASARFGVTIDYLADADQLQIKISQGSKPGEGGQLPGHKVDGYIAKLRFSTPGVELISPPPHHDIYSIEDLKQLIYDLRCANPRASVSVKLAAEVGVGTVAAGVAKANADHLVIAGHDGGTGASPLSSIQAAGVPWEIGLAETQQTLRRNDLRSRLAVQADGQLRTGRDVVVAALLGADEMGFSTAPLIATGCIMMRVCHLNTCPVGIATQDPELRERFAGTPDQVVTYFLHVAEETRQIMAGLGVTRFEDLVGRVDLLEPDAAVEHWKARGVDLSGLLDASDVPDDAPRRRTRGAEPVLDDSLEHLDLIWAVRPAIESGERVVAARSIKNSNRATGALISNEIVRRHGPEGLPEGTVELGFEGSAGQSFGAWLAPGMSLTLHGEANDYAGKGLSGGLITIRPPKSAGYTAEGNVIVGNVVLYGATSGRAFFNGQAGERFAVRNSGALAVVEGVGDHCCEYMTGGRVAVIGPTGVNFAAGMSGGIAWVLDEDGGFAARCNKALVDLEPLSVAGAAELKELLAEHHARTGSAVAERLLDDWTASTSRFVTVMPRDYRRALEERQDEPEAEPERVGA